MPGRPPIPLTPARVAATSAEYRELLSWPYPDEPFYEGQVRRALRTDVRQRVLSGEYEVWVYRDPDGHTVGFGTLTVSRYYTGYAGGKPHPYIPLLGVHPRFLGRGHGRDLIGHLVAEAVILALSDPDIAGRLFLDVYTANDRAVAVYQKLGFEIQNPDAPIPDPRENNEPYFVMAKNLAVSPPPPSP